MIVSNISVRPLIEYTNPYVKVIEGETAELECNILVGKPKPKISWLRNGGLVRETDRLLLQDGNKIIITNAMEEDDGDYVCVASNIGGNETYNVNLDVLGMLIFLTLDKLNTSIRTSDFLIITPLR